MAVAAAEAEGAEAGPAVGHTAAARRVAVIATGIVVSRMPAARRVAGRMPVARRAAGRMPADRRMPAGRRMAGVVAARIRVARLAI